MNMKKSVFLLITGAILIWGCGPKSKGDDTPSDKKDTNQIQTVTRVDSAALIKPQAVQVLKNYYASLEAENMDENQFFAPTVGTFYNSKDISAAKIGESIKDGFKKMDDRKIEIDESSIVCQVIPEGYELIVGGSSSHKDVAKKRTVEGVFRNRIVMNRNMKIIYYNSAPDVARGMNETNELTFAEQVVASFQNGATLNNFIHPDKGVVCTWRTGVFDRIEVLQSAEEMKKEHVEVWGAISSSRCNGITMNKIPSFTCDDEFKEKGCFLAQVTDFNEAARTADELNKLKDPTIKYNSRERGTLKSMENRVTHQLIITESRLLLGFGQIDGKWYLLEINASKFDCSA